MQKVLEKIKLIPGARIIRCGHRNREYLIETVKASKSNYEMTVTLDRTK